MSFIRNYANYCKNVIKTSTAMEDFGERIDGKNAVNLLPNDVRAKLKLADEDIVVIRREDLNKIVIDMWGE